MYDRDGNATTYGYDAANRVTDVTGRGRKINYQYDEVGNVVSVESGDTTNYGYR
jgi:YD repeat-containing protein